MSKIKINEKDRDELAALVAMTSGDPVKNGKALNMSFRIDKAIANFIENPEPKGVALIIDAEKRAKMWEAVNNAGALTDLKQKRVLCLAILQADVKEHVNGVLNKLTKNGSVALTDAQKDALAKAGVKYHEHITRKLMPQVEEIAVELGIAKPANEPVGASQQAAQVPQS